MLRGDLLRAKALGLNAYRLSVDWGNDEVERRIVEMPAAGCARCRSLAE
jgi:hypothetical protein